MEEMTLDELARMIAEGFNEVNKRLGVLEARVDSLEKEMRLGFREVHARIDQLVTLHEGHSRRIKALELGAS